MQGKGYGMPKRLTVKDIEACVDGFFVERGDR